MSYEASKNKLTKEFIDADIACENAEMDLSELRKARSSKVAVIELGKLAQEHMLEMEAIHIDERKFSIHELLDQQKEHVISDFEEMVMTFSEPISREIAHRKFDELIHKSLSAICKADVEIPKAQLTANLALRDYNRAKFSLERYD